MVLVATPVSMRVIATLAPGTAAPEGSDTVPFMLPVEMVDWDERLTGSRSRITIAIPRPNADKR